MTRPAIVAVCAVLLCAGGCTTYYKVTDPTTGKEYYTTRIEEKKSGATTLKDARTGNTINVQNSEITEISKEEFETGKVAPAAPPPTAAKTGTETSPFISTR
jgi:hypothetical protein